MRHRYSIERAEELLALSFKNGDVAKKSARHPGEWLVSSSQDPKVFYRVRKNENGKYDCGCKSSQKRGECRHFVRVSWELANEKRVADGKPRIPPPAGYGFDGSALDAAA